MWNDDKFNDLHHLIMGNPRYFYRVNEFVTTFEDGKSFSNETDFYIGDIKECKIDAEKFYLERSKGFESGEAKFHYNFESPKNFKLGENSAYSITLTLIEYYNKDYQLEYVLYGDDDDICNDNREIENNILKNVQ